MPLINDYICDRCRFQLPRGWGGYMYVMDDTGRRIVCPHPDEDLTVRAVLGNGATPDLIYDRTGFNSECICVDCLSQTELDLKRDLRVCRSCNSKKVRSVSEMVDQPCPKCRVGKIKEIWTGAMS